MSTIEQIPGGPLAVAFQASKKTEGSDDQTIYFKLSTDGGHSWDAHTVAESESQAVWGPVLHWDKNTQRLFMFFSASVPENRRGSGRSYPGGDVKYMTTSDFKTWSSPITILNYTDINRGNISKVTANKPAISPDGQKWILPFWQEGHTANDTGPNCAGVMVSVDAGQSWKASPACLSSKDAGWLIENTLAYTTAGDLLMLFRTKEGHIWQSRSSDDGHTWTTPNATDRLNPNSKVFMFARPDTNDLVLAYNPSSSGRNPLALALSKDSGRSWTDFVTLDSGGVKNFAYPTSTQIGSNILTTYSASIHNGIRLAITAAP